MQFKLNKLTLLLLSAPLIANAGISHNGSEHNILPSNLATNITDNQEHTIKYVLIYWGRGYNKSDRTNQG